MSDEQIKPASEPEQQQQETESNEIPLEADAAASKLEAGGHGSPLVIDVRTMKLGKKPRKWDRRTLVLASYMPPRHILPPPPDSCDWTKGISQFGMMLNDRLGCCTIAACAHAIQIWTANTGEELTLSDAVIEHYYERWDGYNPADPNTDCGGVELDVLTQWKNQSLEGNQLIAFAAINVSDIVELRQAINWFGGIYIGLALPLTAQDQDVWDVPSDIGSNPDAAPESWGGHAVFIPKYNADGTFDCITWGGLKKMTAAFMHTYCDESYATLGKSWITKNGSPLGFNVDQLQADLAALQRA